MNLENFINNFRAGVAEADRQAANFINQVGNDMNRVWNNTVAPFQMVGDQIGQRVNDIVNKTFQSPQPVKQVTPTQPVQQPQLVSTSTPVVNTVQQQPQQQINPNMTYYVRDPAIDGFVNTLRFMMNPIRGITGWTPLDIVADTTSDGMYGLFGKKYTPASNDTNNNDKQPDTTETTKPAEEAKLTSADNSDVVTYTYKPGDTFGQVILDLGLGTGNGLWGTNGDVDYYTRQLIEQGALNNYGNIPIGTTIKLRRRK